MNELIESIMKIACKLSVNILDDVNMTIDEQKTKAEVSNCVDRESFNLELSCAMEIVEMYKKEAEKQFMEKGEKSECNQRQL